MDGNRRWAKEKKLPTMMGHKKGVEALKKTVIACEKFGVKYLTVYAFSTENWNREKDGELKTRLMYRDMILLRRNTIRNKQS